MRVKQIQLAGVYYSWALKQGMTPHLSVGDEVELVRRPDSKFDVNQVDVRHEEAGLVGNIPKEYAAKLSPWLLQHQASAKITEIDLGEVPPRIIIQLWRKE